MFLRVILIGLQSRNVATDGHILVTFSNVQGHMLHLFKASFVRFKCLNTVEYYHLQESGIKLTDEEIEMLLDELDKDGDGEINYRYDFLCAKIDNVTYN